MKLQDQVIKDLERMEGFIPHYYEDHLGFATIGIGRLIDKRRGGGISKKEAYYLLENDISRVSKELTINLSPWFSSAPEGVKRALINMCFQMGINGVLSFKNTLMLLRQGRYHEAADNALKSKWARQTPSRAQEVTNWIRNSQEEI